MSWEALSDLIRYDVHAADDATTVRLAGELDLASPQLADLIEEVESQAPRVILDLSRVSFLDASGLSLVLRANRRIRETGGELLLRRPHRAVRRILELCGSEAVFRIEEPPGWLEPTPDVVAICAQAVDAAIDICRAPMANAQLVDPSGALHIVAERGFYRPFLDFFDVVDDSESSCGTARSSGKAVYVPDITRSPIYLGAPSLDAMRDAGVRSVASVPVFGSEGDVVGMVSVHRERPGDWDRGEQRKLRALVGATSRLLDDYLSDTEVG